MGRNLDNILTKRVNDSGKGKPWGIGHCFVQKVQKRRGGRKEAEKDPGGGGGIQIWRGSSTKKVGPERHEQRGEGDVMKKKIDKGKLDTSKRKKGELYEWI